VQLPVSDNSGHAIAGACAPATGNRDRPARRRTHPPGATASSPKGSLALLLVIGECDRD
jgi:hypothetical protein